MKKPKQYEPEEIICGEVFDPGYHEDYFDVDEVGEYGEDEEEDYGSYIDRDLWDHEPDEDDEWGDE